MSPKLYWFIARLVVFKKTVIWGEGGNKIRFPIYPNSVLGGHCILIIKINVCMYFIFYIWRYFTWYNDFKESRINSTTLSFVFEILKKLWIYWDMSTKYNLEKKNLKMSHEQINFGMYFIILNTQKLKIYLTKNFHCYWFKMLWHLRLQNKTKLLVKWFN